MEAETIYRLNALLRDELAAVETYEEALAGRSSRFAQTDLSRCQRSHEVRARMLRDKIASLGGSPATSSGLRGAWERFVEEATLAIGDDMAMRALAAGEDQVLHDYRRSLAKLDPEARSFVERNLLPAEEYTRRTLGELLRRRFD